jgi:hypothetical protein
MTDQQSKIETSDRLTRLEVSLELQLQSMNDKLDALLNQQSKESAEVREIKQAVTVLEANSVNMEKSQLEPRLAKVEKNYSALMAVAATISTVISAIVAMVASVFK